MLEDHVPVRGTRGVSRAGRRPAACPAALLAELERARAGLLLGDADGKPPRQSPRGRGALQEANDGLVESHGHGLSSLRLPVLDAL